MRLRSTHTFVELEVSDNTWSEIAQLLREAGYGHAFIDGRAIDMHGIALVIRPDDSEEERKQMKEPYITVR